MERRRPFVVIRAPGQGSDGNLFPPLGREARDEHVVGARELPADLGDLRGRLPLRQNDFGESDAPQAVEIERVVLTGHRCAG